MDNPLEREHVTLRLHVAKDLIVRNVHVSDNYNKVELFIVNVNEHAIKDMLSVMSDKMITKVYVNDNVSKINHVTNICNYLIINDKLDERYDSVISFITVKSDLIVGNYYKVEL